MIHDNTGELINQFTISISSASAQAIIPRFTSALDDGYIFMFITAYDYNVGNVRSSATKYYKDGTLIQKNYFKG